MKKIIFKRIRGTNYSISNNGDLRNDLTNYMLKAMRNKVTGYLHYQYRVDGEIVHKYVHRLVYETFVGEIPGGKEIDHIDGNRTINNINNLCVMTRGENIRKRNHDGFMETRKYNLEFYHKKIGLYNIYTWDGVLLEKKISREDIHEKYGWCYQAITRRSKKEKKIIFVKNPAPALGNLYKVFDQKTMTYIDSGRRVDIELKYGVDLSHRKKMDFEHIVEKLKEGATITWQNPNYDPEFVREYLREKNK